MLIGEKHKIESDRFNVTLYEKMRVKKTGGIRWQPMAYFSNFTNALKHLVNLKVMETGLIDFRTVVEKQEELYQLIGNLEGLPELVESCTRCRKSNLQGNLSCECQNPISYMFLEIR